jgi:hypothetical protein
VDSWLCVRVARIILLINVYIKSERLDVRGSKMVGSDVRCEMAGCNIVGVDSTLRGLLPQCCQQGAENDNGEREDLVTDSVGGPSPGPHLFRTSLVREKKCARSGHLNQ